MDSSKILDILQKKYPVPKTTLNKMRSKPDAFKILISCLISLRTRDENTKIATEKLFAVAKTPKEILDLPIEKLEELHKKYGLNISFEGGEAESLVIDGPLFKKEIVIEKEKIDSFLGTDTSVTQCKNIFDKLGFDVKVDKQKVFTIVPPSFRGDIVQEVDIIEEVARIIGYDNLPLSMPSIKVSNISESKEIQLRKKIKQILMAQGCSETVTYTMISQKNLNDSKLSDIEKLNIVNPLSQDQEMMRPSLLPSMLSRVQFNLNRGQKDISLFEAGKIYTNKGEKETLAVIMTGVALRDWRKLKQTNVDFVDIKGIVGKVFSGTGIQDSAVSYKISELPFFAGENAQIFLRGKKIGAVGRICQEVLDAWDIKGASVVFAEVDLESFYSGSFSKKKYFPVIEYPIVTRDISLAIKKDILFDEIRNIVFNDNNDIMHNFNLIEEYLGENLPGKEYKGLVCSCKYQSKTGTLKEEEVTKVHERICQSLIDKIGAIRR